MKWIKLFENFKESETLIDLFLDIKDKYSLTEIPPDPFHNRGSMYFKKDTFPPGNSFYVRQSPHLLEQDEDNGYLQIVVLLSTDIISDRSDRNELFTRAHSILVNHYPEFLHDMRKYEESVDSFVKMLGYRSKSAELISFRQCQDFGVLECIFNFHISEYKQKTHDNTEKFLKRVSNDFDKDTLDKLRKLGYKI